MAGADSDLVVGIVNNMADRALAATERQYLRLLRAAAQGARVRVRFFSLPGIPRAGQALTHSQTYYETLEALLRDPPDTLIVTGAEPRTARLQDEAFWAPLTTLIDFVWMRRIPTVWSCLAAHAALLHVDGIERRPAPRKISGVFACRAVSRARLLHGMPRHWHAPHSRLYDIDPAMLAPAGYEILSRAPEAGVDMILRRGAGLQLFLQGHPEYDPDALIREYCRDLGRAWEAGPAATQAVCLPRGLTDARGEAALRQHVAACGAPPAPADLLPFCTRRLDWLPVAVALYRNWLGEIAWSRCARPVPALARSLVLQGQAMPGVAVHA